MKGSTGSSNPRRRRRRRSQRGHKADSGRAATAELHYLDIHFMTGGFLKGRLVCPGERDRERKFSFEFRFKRSCKSAPQMTAGSGFQEKDAVQGLFCISKYDHIISHIYICILGFKVGSSVDEKHFLNLTAVLQNK